jgi:hypothetical protein
VTLGNRDAYIMHLCGTFAVHPVCMNYVQVLWVCLLTSSWEAVCLASAACCML